MSKQTFREILNSAISGNHDDLEKVLALYGPLINKYAVIDGIVDEDLRQYILIHIALNISKFVI